MIREGCELVVMEVEGAVNNGLTCTAVMVVWVSFLPSRSDGLHDS